MKRHRARLTKSESSLHSGTRFGFSFFLLVSAPSSSSVTSPLSSFQSSGSFLPCWKSQNMCIINKGIVCNWINFILFKITEFNFIISAYKVQNLMPLCPSIFCPLISKILSGFLWRALILNQKLCLFWL